MRKAPLSKDKEHKETSKHRAKDIAIEDYVVREEPFYLPVSNEVEIFETACELKLPVMLKAPPAAARPGFWNTWPGG